MTDVQLLTGPLAGASKLADALLVGAELGDGIRGLVALAAGSLLAVAGLGSAVMVLFLVVVMLGKVGVLLHARFHTLAFPAAIAVVDGMAHALPDDVAVVVVQHQGCVLPMLA